MSAVTKIENLTSSIVKLSQDATYLVDASPTSIEVYASLDEHVQASTQVLVDLEIIADNGSGNGVLRRSDKIKWSVDGFSAGMDITLVGTVSNNTTIQIVSVNDYEILVAPLALVAETITLAVGTITAEIPATDWFLIDTVSATHKLTVSELSPSALKFVDVGVGGGRVWVRS